jgi:hypothetical protein
MEVGRVLAVAMLLVPCAALGDKQIGVSLALRPVGRFHFKGTSVTWRTEAAPNVGLFGDLFFGPNVSVGIATSLTFAVSPANDPDEDNDERATQLDLEARVTGWLPLSPRASVYGGLGAGYSALFFVADVDRSDGPLVAARAGGALDLGAHFSAAVELGGVAAFQSNAQTQVLEIAISLARRW